jgi:hypothetical protein
MLARFTEFYRRGDYVDIDNEFLYAIYRANHFSNEESGALIGLTFRISLAGMIFTSDVMTNGGYVVPKNRVLGATDPLGDYFRVSVHLSFLSFFDEYVYPHFRGKRPGLDRAAYIDSLGLRSIEAYLKVSPKFGAMTNEDDFIFPGT